MNLVNALPAGTVIKLKEAEKKVIIIGIMQQTEIDAKIRIFDYIGVPYPEGFLGTESVILFQETDIESVTYMGYSDIERQQLIVSMAEKVSEIINNPDE